MTLTAKHDDWITLDLNQQQMAVKLENEYRKLINRIKANPRADFFAVSYAKKLEDLEIKFNGLRQYLSNAAHDLHRNAIERIDGIKKAISELIDWIFARQGKYDIKVDPKTQERLIDICETLDDPWREEMRRTSISLPERTRRPQPVIQMPRKPKLSPSFGKPNVAPQPILIVEADDTTEQPVPVRLVSDSRENRSYNLLGLIFSFVAAVVSVVEVVDRIFKVF